AERPRNIHPQGIDDGVAVGRRELEEVDTLDVAVAARAFGIDGDHRDIGDRGEESIDRFGRIEIERSRGPLGYWHGVSDTDETTGRRPPGLPAASSGSLGNLAVYPRTGHVRSDRQERSRDCTGRRHRDRLR